MAGQKVFLSFDIGPDASLLQAWHFSNGEWTTYSPDDLIYSENVASFSVTDSAAMR